MVSRYRRCYLHASPRISYVKQEAHVWICFGRIFLVLIQSLHEQQKYIPGQHDGSIHIQTVNTATTQTDFMRTITK